jgi:cytochrome c biogenesis protein CcmG/thiol:disulfide interchange protein DsbE|tara:strand:- start:3094 stop:3615 length:522 start_codon:yes stop_codon:yes gene_type:complete
MKINFFKILFFGFVIFIILVFWLGLKKDNNYNTSNLTGSKISSFELKSLQNNDFISDKKLKQNQFTLINFFASWCAPCRIEHKYLINLANENKKIKILGVNFKDNKNNAIKFLDKLGNPYDFVAQDLEGKASILFGVYGIPESILINNELTVIKKVIGPLDQTQYEEILKLIK